MPLEVAVASFSCAFPPSHGTIFKREHICFCACPGTDFLTKGQRPVSLDVLLLPFPIGLLCRLIPKPPTPSSFFLLLYSSGPTSVNNGFWSTPSSFCYSGSLPFPANLHPARQWPSPRGSQQDPSGDPHLAGAVGLCLASILVGFLAFANKLLLENTAQAGVFQSS